MKLLVLDNYDSFVYNIIHILKEIKSDLIIDVRRNDKITLGEVDQFDKILLSPGPGVPSEAGVMPDIIRVYGESKSILGVCLGHQGIGEIYGASLINLAEVYHGLALNTTLVGKDILFDGIPEKFKSGRYHSWAVDPTSNLQNIVVTAVDDNGNIMALRHKTYNVRGVQFHPESVLTEYGKKLLQNWIQN